MKTQKGFMPILLILLGLIVVGGGMVYFNNYNFKQNTDLIPVENFEEKIETENSEQNVSTSTVKNININNNEEIYGFSFKTDNPSIVHTFTKSLAKSKSDITESEILNSHGSVFYKDADEIIVEFKRSHCCGGGERYSLYAYANKNSDLITAITFNDDFKPNGPITPDYIKSLIPLYKNELARTMPILQSPPTDKVVDGYYYASVNDWNPSKKELEIDFLTISDEPEPYNGYEVAFDVLMSVSTYYYSVWTNIQLENNLVNTRKFKVIDSLANKINWEGLTNKNSDNLDLWKNSNCFIKIENGQIVEITMVVAAG